MKQENTAHAGTLESCDILITLKCLPKGSGRKISINSATEALFGKHVQQLIEKKLDTLNLQDVELTAEDKGALDPTILARLETAYTRLNLHTKE